MLYQDIKGVFTRFRSLGGGFEVVSLALMQANASGSLCAVACWIRQREEVVRAKVLGTRVYEMVVL